MKMRKLYTGVLVAHLVIEIIGASALLMAPDFLVDAGNASALLWSWNYAFVALGVASLVFWAWPHRESYAASGVALGILASFHLALGIALLIKLALLPDIILHNLFGLLCLYLYFKRSAWCTDAP